MTQLRKVTRFSLVTVTVLPFLTLEPPSSWFLAIPEGVEQLELPQQINRFWLSFVCFASAGLLFYVSWIKELGELT
jgi:hypothetical protein